jgi:hypothetical protein
MKKITMQNAVDKLLERIPEFKEYNYQLYKDNLNLPTIIFDFFGDFLLERSKMYSPEDIVIKKSFDFINEMQDSDDPEVQNLSQVGVFEVLASSKEGTVIAEKYLNDRGREWFNKIKGNFRP